MAEQSEYVELVRISDPVQADLLAAFLEDGDIEFQVVNRSGAGFMSQLIPRSANPVLFRILVDDLERGKVLLSEYQMLQQKPSSPDDADEEEDEEGVDEEDVGDGNRGSDHISDDEMLEGEDEVVSDWDVEVDASADERD
jgi:hypothetical protein